MTADDRDEQAGLSARPGFTERRREDGDLPIARVGWTGGAVVQRYGWPGGRFLGGFDRRRDVPAMADHVRGLP